MPAINIPIDEALLHEIRVHAAQNKLTRKEWIQRALAEASRRSAEARHGEKEELAHAG